MAMDMKRDNLQTNNVIQQVTLIYLIEESYNGRQVRRII